MRPGPRKPTLNRFYWIEERHDAFCLNKMTGQLGARPGDVVAFGHTGEPWHRVVGGIHFVNTGSVGRPKDGDPRACYVRLSLGEGGWRVKFVRVGNDVQRVTNAPLRSGLPAGFADHLW